MKPQDDILEKFSAACYSIREMRPTMTVSGLLTVLEVATEDKPMPYQELLHRRGLSYNSTAIQISVLSDGRGKNPGAGFLERIPGADRKQKLLVMTDKGRDLIQCFSTLTSGETSRKHLLNQIEKMVIPALAYVNEASSHMNLGVFSTFLFIAQNEDRFAAGEPSRIVAEELKLNNLPKAMFNLTGGHSNQNGLGLIKVSPAKDNRRRVVPKLSSSGRRLIDNITSVLTSQDIDAQNEIDQKSDHTRTILESDTDEIDSFDACAMP